MIPPVVSLVGKPESGKTTLLEKLLPELKRRGFIIGTIKHHVHQFEMDRPGKDTWRHKQAGAHTVALSSPTGIGIIGDTDHDPAIGELVGRYFIGTDLVITEGYKQEAMPKIEVFRSTRHETPLENRDSTWIAIVSDTAVESDLPRFDLNDINGLADFLVFRFIKKPAPKGVALLVNNRPIPLNAFVTRFLRGSILGMLASLRGCRNPAEVTLVISKANEQDEEC